MCVSYLYDELVMKSNRVNLSLHPDYKMKFSKNKFGRDLFRLFNSLLERK